MEDDFPFLPWMILGFQPFIFRCVYASLLLRNFASETSGQAAVVLEVLFPAAWPRNLCLNGHDMIL